MLLRKTLAINNIPIELMLLHMSRRYFELGRNACDATDAHGPKSFLCQNLHDPQ
jgi:hypothetical protein